MRYLIYTYLLTFYLVQYFIVSDCFNEENSSISFFFLALLPLDDRQELRELRRRLLRRRHLGNGGLVQAVSVSAAAEQVRQ